MKTSEKLTELLESGLSQVLIARESGIPQGTISRILAGQDPRESTASAIDAVWQKRRHKQPQAEKDAA